MYAFIVQKSNSQSAVSSLSKRLFLPGLSDKKREFVQVLLNAFRNFLSRPKLKKSIMLSPLQRDGRLYESLVYMQIIPLSRLSL